MRIIAIDHGSKKCGIAVSDYPYDFIWPKDVVPTKVIHDYLRDMISEYNIEDIVIGMPYMLNGSEGEQCQSVKKFMQEINTYFDKNIHKVDERMTSVMAKKLYDSDLDSSVAAIILEIFLSQNKV